MLGGNQTRGADLHNRRRKGPFRQPGHVETLTRGKPSHNDQLLISLLAGEIKLGGLNRECRNRAIARQGFGLNRFFGTKAIGTFKHPGN